MPVEQALTMDPTTGRRAQDGLSVLEIVRPDTNLPRVFLTFTTRLIPKLRRFNPKSLDFSQFKYGNITKTYLSQIIKSKLRKLESRKEKKLKNPSSRMQQVPTVLALKSIYFSVSFITRYVGFH